MKVQNVLRSGFALFMAGSLSIVATDVYGFGSKRKDPAPSNPKPPQLSGTQAFPSRRVSFGNFYKSHFILPDGKTNVDLSVLLPELVLTSMTQATTKFRPGIMNHITEDGVVPPEPEDRFILRGGVTAFEAEIVNFNIRIGYKPGVGNISTGKVPEGKGELRVKIGQLDMDFYILDTVTKEVVAVGKANSKTAGIQGEISIEFDKFKTAADFMYKSPMANVFRKVATRALTEMVKDPKTNFFMYWGATVGHVDPAAKIMMFDAGQRSDIAVGNVFSVYDNSKMRLGEVRVTETDFETSTAVFQNDTTGRLINSTRDGDTVKIYFFSVPNN